MRSLPRTRVRTAAAVIAALALAALLLALPPDAQAAIDLTPGLGIGLPNPLDLGIPSPTDLVGEGLRVLL